MTSKTISTTQTLFDLSIDLYGDTSYVFKLIEDNSVFTSLQSPVLVGMNVYYDKTIIYNSLSLSVTSPSIPVSTIKEYKTTELLTAFDLAIKLYGSTGYLFKLIEDNPVITSILFILPIGSIISYDTTATQSTSIPVEAPSSLSISEYRVVTIRENQSLFDISLQMYGGLEDVFQLLLDNPEVDNLNNGNLVGYNMKYKPKTIELTEYLRTSGIYITTGSPDNRSFDNSFDLSFN